MNNDEDVNRITAANIAAWEEAAPLHRRRNMKRLLAQARDPGGSCLDEIETAQLRELGVEGSDVAQVCCNNGRELISVKKLGAGRCVGFEGAQGFVDQATELARASSVDCEFVCTDVYEIDSAYHRCFDIVTVTIGVLGWMPDLDRFFAVLAGLLRPGGALFIYEQHPVIGMIEPGKADEPVVFEYSYFQKEPWIEANGLDYYGGETYASKPMYCYPMKMSDVIMAGIGNGLVVEKFEELPGHISMSWHNLEAQGPVLPMSYVLVLRRPA